MLLIEISSVCRLWEGEWMGMMSPGPFLYKGDFLGSDLVGSVFLPLLAQLLPTSSTLCLHY